MINYVLAVSFIYISLCSIVANRRKWESKQYAYLTKDPLRRIGGRSVPDNGWRPDTTFRAYLNGLEWLECIKFWK